MAANRPQRKKPTTHVEYNSTSWTLPEKRGVQRALLKYSPQEIQKIAKVVGTKSPKEVRAYLDFLEEKLKKNSDSKPKDAIYAWSSLASDLISCEIKDYSEVLSEVIGVAAYLENPASETETINEGPDYNKIYQYISAVLAGEDLPNLDRLESSIIVDLMHGLIDTIRTHDTSRQQEVMIRKYHLLSSKIDINNIMVHVERCRKAITNDFSDFLNTGESSNADINDRPSTSSETSTHIEQPPDSLNDSRDVHGTDISKNRKRSQESKNQQNKSIPTPAKLMKLATSVAEGNCSGTKTVNSNDFDNSNTCPSENQNLANTSINEKDSAAGNNDDAKKKKEVIPKKPSLFTLNPYCIPIDLLKFQPLVSSDVVFNRVMKPIAKLQQVQQIIPGKSRGRNNDQKNSGIEVICVNEKQDVIGREKFIAISNEDQGH